MTDSRTAFYRRTPGVAWLIGAAAVPLLIAGIGMSAPSGWGSHTGTTVAESSVGEEIPAEGYAPTTLIWDHGKFTAVGVVTTEAAKDAATSQLRAVAGPDATINIGVDPATTAAVTPPDLSGAAPVFEAAKNLSYLGVRIDGSSVLLVGDATSSSDVDAVADAVEETWPGLHVINRIEIGEPPSSGAPATTPAQPAPETSASETAAAPAPDAPDCQDLPTDVSTLIGKPITFDTGGVTLTSESEQTVTAIAGKVASCPGAKVTIIGHTDDTGDDSVNNPLSVQRADAVGRLLVANGVPFESISTGGVVAAQPIAANDTEDGRALNRRVDVTVSAS